MSSNYTEIIQRQMDDAIDVYNKQVKRINDNYPPQLAHELNVDLAHAVASYLNDLPVTFFHSWTSLYFVDLIGALDNLKAEV